MAYLPTVFDLTPLFPLSFARRGGRVSGRGAKPLLNSPYWRVPSEKQYFI
jgi:hypothetical protein